MKNKCLELITRPTLPNKLIIENLEYLYCIFLKNCVKKTFFELVATIRGMPNKIAIFACSGLSYIQCC